MVPENLGAQWVQHAIRYQLFYCLCLLISGIQLDQCLRPQALAGDQLLLNKRFGPLIRDGKGTKGIDPPKTNWAQKLDTPPYVAYSSTGGLTFTYGGIKVNRRCQVLDRF